MVAWRNEIFLLPLKKYFTCSLRSLVKYFSTLEEKFRISARPCNILYVLKEAFPFMILTHFCHFIFSIVFFCHEVSFYYINFDNRIRPRPNVELFMRGTKLSELRSWKVRRLARLSSFEWVWIVQHRRIAVWQNVLRSPPGQTSIFTYDELS